jgi:hypothetical protein
MRSIKPTTIRLSEDDKALIETVKRRYGVSSTIQAIRLALRMIAERDDAKQRRSQEDHTHSD